MSSIGRHRTSRARTSVTRTIDSTPRQNLERYIEAGRLCGAFGEIEFDARTWEVPTRTNMPGGSALGELAFTVSSIKRDPATPAMDERFAAFMKATIRLEHQSSPSQINKHRRTLAVGRIIYKAAADVDHDPCRLSSSIFARALVLSADARSEVGTIYEVGIILQRLAKTLNDAGIASHRIEFRNAGRKQEQVRPINDDEEDDRMPSERALEALTRVSQLVTAPEDVLRIRVVELLMCASWRIIDVMRLPIDCEVHEPVTRNGKTVLNPDGSPAMRYGLGYRGSKGFIGDVKWITTPMVDVAKRAIADIREITDEPRRAALWMEKNPGRAWVHPDYRLQPRSRILSRIELGKAIGLNPVRNIAKFIERYGLQLSDCSTSRKWRYRLGDVEDAMLRNHKAIQGDFIMKRSEYLLLAFRNTFATARGVLSPIVDVVHYSAISDFLRSKPGKQSIFERFDLRDEKGEPYRLGTHQLRHFMNTIAAEGGLGEIERARWSGRADVRSNEAYDHESGYRLAEKARKVLEQGRMRGPIAVTAERLPPVERSAFTLVHLATVHTTEIGMCLHDWGTAPCPHHGACADCRDCAIVKGDAVHRTRTELLLGEEETTLRRALAEVEEETYGASNYVEHHRRMAAGYRRMLAIHDDPEIEDGTLVQIEPEEARTGLLGCVIA
jgi:hypothetical protein